MKEPSSWAMKAGKGITDYLSSLGRDIADYDPDDFAPIIESAWEEHQASGMRDFQNEYMNAVTAQQLAKFTVDRRFVEHATKVARLVAAAKEVHGELHGLHNGSGYWIRFCSALADLEK